MSIGTKIKQLRVKSGLTQEQLANKIGVTPQSISKWETEATMPDITMLPLISTEFGITIDENSVRNNSAYIKAWQDKLTEDPSALFTAIADADKISRYVIAKEQEFNKSQAIEYYAIKQDKNDYDDIVFKAYMISEYGQVRQILGYAFESRDALMKEFNVMKGLTY